MAEARRYFRHLIPGLFFVVELALLLAFSYRDQIEFSSLVTGNSLTVGVVLAVLGVSVVGAGTFGYALSMLHHLTTGVPFYHNVLQWAEGKGKIELVLRDTKRPVRVSDLGIGGTWMVLSAVWLQNTETLNELKSAHAHTESLGSIFHGIGATMWGSIFAGLLWFGAVEWWSGGPRFVWKIFGGFFLWLPVYPSLLG
jgi:hypothetical protein